jgi:hypothetical protein
MGESAAALEAKIAALKAQLAQKESVATPLASLNKDANYTIDKDKGRYFTDKPEKKSQWNKPQWATGNTGGNTHLKTTEKGQAMQQQGDLARPITYVNGKELTAHDIAVGAGLGANAGGSTATQIGWQKPKWSQVRVHLCLCSYTSHF